MRQPPPEELVDLLGRLRLATAADFQAAYPLARRWAGALPMFASVWVDALRQSRKLTAYQAAEINAGRGGQLEIGPWTIDSLDEQLGYASIYLARRSPVDRPVRLVVVRSTPDAAKSLAAEFSSLNEKLAAHASALVGCPAEIGVAGPLVWLTYPNVAGQSIAQLMQRRGRLPAEVVLATARQMVGALTPLASAGFVHGDISATNVRLTTCGECRLEMAGLRPIVHPAEGFSFVDLPCEAYDNLAPERVAGVGASVASDVYACGCLWWRMLAGRPPLAGGDAASKLRSALAAKIPDVRRFAPDCPPRLASAIAACLAIEPAERPKSLAALSEMLGQAHDASHVVRRWLGRQTKRTLGPLKQTRSGLPDRGTVATWTVAVAGCAALVAIILWPARETGHSRTGVDKQAIAGVGPSGGAGDKQSPATATQPKKTRRDPAVVQASFAEPSASTPVVPPLVLRGEQPTWPTAIRSGQTVRASPGERAKIIVPRHGLVISQEDLRLENIDFVWTWPAEPGEDRQPPAMLQLRASRIALIGCTMTSALATDQPVAIRWSGASRRGALAEAGRIEIARCVLSGVSAGVECSLRAPLAFKVEQALCLGSGPLLRLPAPQPEDPVEIELNHCTCRDVQSLLEIVGNARQSEVGAINVTATDCALSPILGGSLIAITGSGNGKLVSRALEWTGSGSLLASESPVGLVVGRKSAPLEIELNVEGLVAGNMQFAGPASGGPGASRLVRWQGSSQSEEPPGIGELP